MIMIRKLKQTCKYIHSPDGYSLPFCFSASISTAWIEETVVWFCMLVGIDVVKLIEMRKNWLLRNFENELS